MRLSTLGSDLVYLFFPEYCTTCGASLFRNEKIVCTRCLADIPEFQIDDVVNNEIAKLFWGRVNIEYAFSLYRFQKGGKYQSLMHELKYKGNKEVGIEFGKWLGIKLKKRIEFNEVDVIIPVPLHWKKEKLRGYNQSELIARGASYILNKPVITNCLVRTIETNTQTKKTRIERWENVESIFSLVNNPKIDGKHILLIDDIVTTGATLEACAQKILTAKDTKVSIATLAVA
ncbi:MAG: ComF family protein [Bacteroidales bacterium]|nr:ComF family protein [Bacteroidales bacterium]